MKQQAYMLMILTICLLSCSTSRLTESSKLDKKAIQQSMAKALEWQEANPIFSKAPTDWTNGAYYTGVTRAHQATGDQVYLDALTEMANRNKWQPWERFFHADDLVICYAYLYLNSLDPGKADLGPTAQIIEDHLHKPHSWREGVEDGGR